MQKGEAMGWAVFLRADERSSDSNIGRDDFFSFIFQEKF